MHEKVKSSTTFAKGGATIAATCFVAIAMYVFPQTFWNVPDRPVYHIEIVASDAGREDGQSSNIEAALKKRFGAAITTRQSYGQNSAEQIRKIASEAASRNPAIILAMDAVMAKEALDHRVKAPLLFSVYVDPVEWKLVDSLAKPGNRATGLTRSVAVSGKLVEALHLAFPRTQRVAVITDGQSVDAVPECVEMASQLGLTAVPFQARNLNELSEVIDKLKTKKIDGVVVPVNAVAWKNSRYLINALNQQAIPSAFEGAVFRRDGALISITIDEDEMQSLLLNYVSSILAGATVGDLPVARPKNAKVYLNTKTAIDFGFIPTPSAVKWMRGS